LRLEVTRDGIKVVLVEPGGFKTGIWTELNEDVARHAGPNYEVGYQRTRSLLKLFMGLMGEPEGVAKTPSPRAHREPATLSGPMRGPLPPLSRSSRPG